MNFITAIAVSVFIFPALANAAPLIVDSVTGHNATIYVPANVTVKPGDELVLKDQNDNKIPQANASNQTHPSRTTLRSRHNNLAVEMESTSTKITLDGASEKSTQTKVDIQYGYDFGYVQPFIAVASSDLNHGDVDVATSQLGCRFNFIKNVPGNDFVPYASIGSAFFNEDNNTDGETIINIEGNAAIVGVGLDWFPFGEIFAIEVNYIAAAGNLNATSSTASTEKAKARISGLSIGYLLAF